MTRLRVVCTRGHRLVTLAYFQRGIGVDNATALTAYGDLGPSGADPVREVTFVRTTQGAVARMPCTGCGGHSRTPAPRLLPAAVIERELDATPIGEVRTVDVDDLLCS